MEGILTYFLQCNVIRTKSEACSLSLFTNVMTFSLYPNMLIYTYPVSATLK
jgi:hypothetical protein